MLLVALEEDLPLVSMTIMVFNKMQAHIDVEQLLEHFKRRLNQISKSLLWNQ